MQAASESGDYQQVPAGERTRGGARGGGGGGRMRRAENCTLHAFYHAATASKHISKELCTELVTQALQLIINKACVFSQQPELRHVWSA